jgi:nitrate reductase gamma subunit
VYVRVYVLYCTVHVCTYVYVRRYRTQCVPYTWLAATYRSCNDRMLKSLSVLVQLCALLMFRIAAS